MILLVDGGVPAEVALATATSRAAEGCGLTDRKGRLRVGTDADLLVVDGDPVRDSRAVRNVRDTYLRGGVVTGHG